MLRRFSVVIGFIILISLLQLSCGGCGGDEGYTEIPDTITGDKDVVIEDDAINEIIQSFPSPVETAALVQNLDLPFSKGYLIDPELADDYDTNFKKAFALGVLSADLGYLNVYEKTNLVIDYLSAIKKIADDLKVGQFFDFQSLKRLATSSDNIDSLLFLSVTSFHQMDEHLRNNARSNLSVLVITGVWIEGLYLLTQVSKDNPTQEVKDRIGEQKTLLNILAPILNVYKSETYFSNLVDDVEDIQKAFEDITITYEVLPSTTEIIDGRVVITQNEISIVEITDEQLNDIVEITEKVRNKLIAL